MTPHRGVESLARIAGDRLDLSAIAKPPAWVGSAICPEFDMEAFFPEKGQSTQYAKAVCAMCPVRQACLDYAVRNDERFGVWGGLSERARRRLKRSAA